ncbi:hypothetical protein AZE42_08516 [Rhizopogon vesiculosus]|uniref:Uncharacterized protein n=1 Tax=Rhizopogon vesiculosus TaxID=180088 RepID=A0A1J8Q2S6_9AGAM|nr:hypothetical protein AZE42_08516 [Rhizopogon vesiculosus]
MRRSPSFFILVEGWWTCRREYRPERQNASYTCAQLVSRQLSRLLSNVLLVHFRSAQTVTHI